MESITATGLLGANIIKRWIWVGCGWPRITELEQSSERKGASRECVGKTATMSLSSPTWEKTKCQQGRVARLSQGAQLRVKYNGLALKSLSKRQHQYFEADEKPQDLAWLHATPAWILANGNALGHHCVLGNGWELNSLGRHGWKEKERQVSPAREGHNLGVTT